MVPEHYVLGSVLFWLETLEYSIMYINNALNLIKILTCTGDFNRIPAFLVENAFQTKIILWFTLKKKKKLWFCSNNFLSFLYSFLKEKKKYHLYEIIKQFEMRFYELLVSL